MRHLIYVGAICGQFFFIAHSRGDTMLPVPVAHFSFDGDFDNDGSGPAAIDHRNTEFKNDALYLNGEYEHGRGDHPHRAVISTPTVSPEAFTVCLRFAAEEFGRGKTNVLTGGTSHRWFGMNRSANGALEVTLNNQDYSHHVAKTRLPVRKWRVVACAVDIPSHNVVVYFNGKKVDEFSLPTDLELRVLEGGGTKDRNWSFTNYSMGNVLQGLVDEFILFDRALNAEEFKELHALLKTDGATSSPASVPVARESSDSGSLVGNWVNDDPQGGLTRVAIERKGKKWSIQAWGECHPVDCDWGTVPLEVLGENVEDHRAIYGLARWNNNGRQTTMTMKPEESMLVVETFKVYGEGATRANFYSTARLRAQDTDGASQQTNADANSKEVNDLITVYEAEGIQGTRAAADQIERKLSANGETAGQIARALLKRKPEFISDISALEFFDQIEASGKDTLAAELLLRVIRAQGTVQKYGGGHVVVGQLIVEDERTDPELVMAQMPILSEGYFAGEVGDLTRPICFRSHGYQNLDVPLDPNGGDVVSVGTVTLQPLKSDQEATLHGTLSLDAAENGESGTVLLSVSVGPINTPHNGYSPRKRWPEDIEVPVSLTGEFRMTGLSPCDYYLQATATGHTKFSKSLSFEPGMDRDVGSCRLFSSDMGFYLGGTIPQSQELEWDKDYVTALARAQSEGRPLLVMMTATWCGPCKKLEKETLSDPWIRHFLSQFVMVKAYEDEAVEQKYGLRGYPTLVFANSMGDSVYKSVGYKECLPFSGECAKAIKQLDLELPPELETLIDKEVVVID